MSKALIEKAVRAAQLYYGSDGYCSVGVQQKLYNRAIRATEAVNKKLNGDFHNDVAKEAERRGPIKPIPGKDY